MPGSKGRPASAPVTWGFTLPLALDLYRELSSGPGNVFFSPFGIASTLVMAQAGAEGATRREIEEVLHCEETTEALVDRVGALAREIRSLAGPKDQALCLSVANALWVQAGYPVRAGFVARVRERLGAEAGQIDFAGRPSDAVRIVNAWVARETGGRIPSILSEGGLGPLTRGLLANAIYLKAPWLECFKVPLTRSLPFDLPDGTRIEVPTMYQEAGFDYGREDDLQALRLSYRNRRLSMIVLLPDRGRIKEVEREWDGARLIRLAKAMEHRDVRVFLPRFQFRSHFALRPVLDRLGMKLAFTAGADFSGMSGEAGFRIDEVVHETFVNVDEYGTEAAAATYTMLMGGVPRPEIEFRVDRPFLFLIRDAHTGTVLFMGRVTDPRSLHGERLP